MLTKQGPISAPSHLAHALLALACMPIFLSLMTWRRARATRRERLLANSGDPQASIALSAAHRAFWSNNHVQPSVPAQLKESPSGGPGSGGFRETQADATVVSESMHARSV